MKGGTADGETLLIEVKVTVEGRRSNRGKKKKRRTEREERGLSRHHAITARFPTRALCYSIKGSECDIAQYQIPMLNIYIHLI